MCSRLSKCSIDLCWDAGVPPLSFAFIAYSSDIPRASSAELRAINSGWEDGPADRLSRKGVLLNFFGDTCEPCLEESPWLVEIQKQDKAKGFEIIGIEMYGASDDAIATYAKHFGTNYTLVHGNEAVSNQYGIGSFPTSYFVNARGTIVSASVGLHSANEIETNVQAALTSD